MKAKPPVQPEAPPAGLTAREWEVWQAWTGARTPAEVGRLLGLTARQTQRHSEQARRKIEAAESQPGAAHKDKDLAGLSRETKRALLRFGIHNAAAALKALRATRPLRVPRRGHSPPPELYPMKCYEGQGRWALKRLRTGLTCEQMREVKA